jgi:hypothetical protein
MEKKKKNYLEKELKEQKRPVDSEPKETYPAEPKRYTFADYLS